MQKDIELVDLEYSFRPISYFLSFILDRPSSILFNMEPPMDLPPAQLASIQYQQEHITDNRIPEMLGVAVCFWALATVAVTGSFYAERMLRNRFKLHDALIVVGLVWLP